MTSIAVDVEKLLFDWAAVHWPDDRVCTETPADLEQIRRTLRIGVAGGGQRFTVSKPRIVLDTFGTAGAGKSARQTAREFALEVHHAMQWDLPGTRLAGRVYVARPVGVVTGPLNVPDSNPLLRHYVATYALSLTNAA